MCEFAFLRFLRGSVIDSYVSLVNPFRPIDPGASAVNGITDEMVACAPSFADLFPRILMFLGDDPLVFHNAPFDLSFLRTEARIAGGAWPGNRGAGHPGDRPAHGTVPVQFPALHLPGTGDRLELPPGGGRRLGSREAAASPPPGRAVPRLKRPRRPYRETFRFRVTAAASTFSRYDRVSSARSSPRRS